MRANRIVLAGHPHHVVLRANNRRCLFSYPREYRRFAFLLARGLIRAECALHAAVFMTNHVHLLVTPPLESALSLFVKTVAQRYAQTRNVDRGGSGKLFEERFFSRPVLTNEQLAVTTAYIELNPVRAGLVIAPNLYRWSSYAWHVGGEHAELPRGLWSPSAWYSELGDCASSRAAKYREWIDACVLHDRRPREVTPCEVRSAFPLLARKTRLERPDRSSAA